MAITPRIVNPPTQVHSASLRSLTSRSKQLHDLLLRESEPNVSTLPAIPTDRLYKFKAVGGIVGVCIVISALSLKWSAQTTEARAIRLASDSVAADSREFDRQNRAADSLKDDRIRPTCAATGELSKRAAVLLDRNTMLKGDFLTFVALILPMGAFAIWVLARWTRSGFQAWGAAESPPGIHVSRS